MYIRFYGICIRFILSQNTDFKKCTFTSTVEKMQTTCKYNWIKAALGEKKYDTKT